MTLAEQLHNSASHAAGNDPACPVCNPKFTQEQSAAYIDNGGQRCPRCGSHDISGGNIDIEAGRASQEVDCKSCGATWFDEYTLTSISAQP